MTTDRRWMAGPCGPEDHAMGLKCTCTAPCLDTPPAPIGNILREETVSPVTRSKDICHAIHHTQLPRVEGTRQ
eukprot:4253299-Heterocapsa_arctica.AAC.1